MAISLSSFELHRIVDELKVLIGAKIEKIFQAAPPKDEFLFVLHVPSLGKRYLYLLLPDVLCLSSFKPVFPDQPPHFCSSLRRKITNARITNIAQQGFERIVNIDVETKLGESRLVIEFLAPGNIILHLPDNKILSVLHPKVWSEERKLLPAKQYAYPSPQTNPYSLTQESFHKLLLETTKESVVKSLAIDASLGGTYAQEVITRSGLDGDLSPQKLSLEQSASLFQALTQVLHAPTQAVVVQGKAHPFLLQKTAVEHVKQCDSYNLALEEVALAQAEHTAQVQNSREQKEQLSKVQKILKAQEQQLSGLEKSKVAQREKGELIYKHYIPIKELFAKIEELRKEHDWSEIKEILKGHPLAPEIKEHDGMLYLELN